MNKRDYVLIIGILILMILIFNLAVVLNMGDSKAPTLLKNVNSIQTHSQLSNIESKHIEFNDSIGSKDTMVVSVNIEKGYYGKRGGLGQHGYGCGGSYCLSSD